MAAARVAPSVVSVGVVRRERQLPRSIFEQMMVPRGYERRVEGLGTGFLVSAVSGAWAIRFLRSYVSKHSFNAFVIYRLALALIVVAALR